ncbi:MAG: hypothetical protein QMD92_04805 [bacterium]|nr:hypothetical protein [bacterium]
MELRNCRKCRKLFISISERNICQECCEKKEKNYDRILEYLNKNPNASVEDICEATKTTKNNVAELVKNEKIALTVSFEYKCEICGKKIKMGKACPECKKKVSNELNKAIDKVKKEEGEAKARDLATKFALNLRDKQKGRR